MFTLIFWRATLERVLVTAAEVLAALLVTDGFDLTDLTGGATWSVVGLAALGALLKCIITASATNGSPAIGSAEELARHRA